MMKKIYSLLMLLLVTMFLTTSCEDFLDVNTDPNNPVSVSPELMLPVAQTYTATYHKWNRGVNTLGNMLMYNWSQADGFAWYPDEFKYNVTASFYDDNFEYAYSNPLKMYAQLNNLDSSNYAAYKAIGMIMQAFHFQLLVDMYGDIPYTEALQRSQLATPKYDKADVVYKALIDQLTSAISYAKDGTNLQSPGSDDVIFGGDMGKWVQFANSLKLRILTRLSGVAAENGYIKSEFDKIAAEGSGFITEDVGINPGYTKIEGQQNPFWNDFGWDASGTITMNNNATTATDYIINYLTNTRDPRIDFIYEKPASGHLGVPQGLLDYDTPIVDQYMPANVSNIGPGILKSASQDAVIYTLAESYLNQAEAALKGLLTGNAQTFYEDGIKASFHYLGVPDSLYNRYMGTSYELVDWTQSPNKLEAIITQKWIAVNGITAEQSWFDYSRTRFPRNLPISLLAPAGKDRPVRLYYPASERTTNTANVPSQPDAFTDKIFWAK